MRSRGAEWESQTKNKWEVCWLLGVDFLTTVTANAGMHHSVGVWEVVTG